MGILSVLWAAEGGRWEEANVGGSGGYFPQENFEIPCSEVLSGASFTTSVLSDLTIAEQVNNPLRIAIDSAKGYACHNYYWENFVPPTH